jgi:hypothetical protein
LIRDALIRLCTAAERSLQATPAPEEIRETVLETIAGLNALGAEKLSAAARADLSLAQNHLANMGWVSATADDASADNKVSESALANAREWLAALPARGVLDGRHFAAGAGRFLDVLDAAGSAEEIRVAMEQAERLLRHVEIARENALARSMPDLSRGQLALERWDAAILFARIAVRHSDLRFLNAAFKMNDWSLKRHSRPPKLAVELSARFVLSLAEQELAAGALL